MSRDVRRCVRSVAFSAAIFVHLLRMKRRDPCARAVTHIAHIQLKPAVVVAQFPSHGRLVRVALPPHALRTSSGTLHIALTVEIA